MKKVFGLAVFVVMMFVITSCGFCADPPEKVYENYLKTLRSGNFSGASSFLSKEYGKMFKDGVAHEDKAVLEILKESIPYDCKVLEKKEKEKDKVVTLRVEAKQQSIVDKTTMVVYGMIEMVKEDGEWKVNKESWGKTRGSEV